jgi:chaperonin cofactor prefoldin
VKKLETGNQAFQENILKLETAKEVLETENENLKREKSKQNDSIKDLEAKLKVALGDAQFKV